MNKYLIFLPLIAGCGTIDQMNCRVNESTASIYANCQAVQESTAVIEQNKTVIEGSTETLKENRKHLETL